MADPEFPQERAPTYDFVKFSRELHEMERNCAPRGTGGGDEGRAPLDPPMKITCSSPLIDLYSYSIPL